MRLNSTLAERKARAPENNRSSIFFLAVQSKGKKCRASPLTAWFGGPAQKFIYMWVDKNFSTRSDRCGRK